MSARPASADKTAARPARTAAAKSTPAKPAPAQDESAENAVAKGAGAKGAPAKAAPGMTDEAVAARTGKTWPAWFALLDDEGADKLDHRGIIELLGRQGVGPWWREMVAVGYERARGLRERTQTATEFAASVSRTVSATMDQAYGAWERPTRRKRFLEEKITFATRRDGKVLRFGWLADASRVSVRFTPRSRTRTQVTIDHEKLKTADDAERMKGFWTEALDRMQALVEKSAD